MKNINVILFRWQHSKLDVGQNVIPVTIFVWSCIPFCYNRGFGALNTTVILWQFGWVQISIIKIYNL
jgi:hypothetical protein